MTQLLDLIERVVPRVRHYPRWAQRLFALSFAMVLVSFLLWVVMAPAAAQTAQHSSVKLAIGVGPSSASGTTMGEVRLAAASNHAANLLDDPVTYALDMSTRTVQPQVPYLGLVRRGGPLGGIEHGTFDWWDAATRLPQLDVKLANTGSTKVYLTSATVHVARSVPDLEPIPIVFRGDMSAFRVFELQNEGWGRMEHASLDYGIAVGTSAAPAGPEPYHAALGTIGVETTVHVGEGATAAKLPSRGQATVWGTLSYSWHDATGGLHKQHDRIVTTVYLGGKAVTVVGASAPIQGEYRVALRMSGQNYDVDVPGFDRFIDPQTPDRFEIRLITGRSSIQSGVVLRLVYSDGHVQRSQPYVVRIFQPRSSPLAG